MVSPAVWGTSQAFPQANPKYSENPDKLLMLPITKQWGSEPYFVQRDRSSTTELYSWPGTSTLTWVTTGKVAQKGPGQPTSLG